MKLKDMFAPETKAEMDGFLLAVKSERGRLNPCVRLYGFGPTGVTCKKCVHLLRIHKGNVYRKCDLRRITNGPGTDHKAGWPACGKYEPRHSESKKRAATTKE